MVVVHLRRIVEISQLNLVNISNTSRFPHDNGLVVDSVHFSVLLLALFTMGRPPYLSRLRTAPCAHFPICPSRPFTRLRERVWRDLQACRDRGGLFSKVKGRRRKAHALAPSFSPSFPSFGVHQRYGPTLIFGWYRFRETLPKSRTSIQREKVAIKHTLQKASMKSTSKGFVDILTTRLRCRCSHERQLSFHQKTRFLCGRQNRAFVRRRYVRSSWRQKDAFVLGAAPDDGLWL